MANIDVSGFAVPALQGVTADSRTIYVGTFSKTMFPALRIGYVILLLNMVANISQAMFLTGQYASGNPAGGARRFH